MMSRRTTNAEDLFRDDACDGWFIGYSKLRREEGVAATGGGPCCGTPGPSGGCPVTASRSGGPTRSAVCGGGGDSEWRGGGCTSRGRGLRSSQWWVVLLASHRANMG